MFLCREVRGRSKYSCCHQTPSVPSAEAVQGHHPACSDVTQEGGKEKHKNYEQCQSHQSNRLAPLIHLAQYQPPKKKGWGNRSSGSVQKGTSVKGDQKRDTLPSMCSSQDYFCVAGLYLDWFQASRESTEDRDWSTEPFSLSTFMEHFSDLK